MNDDYLGEIWFVWWCREVSRHHGRDARSAIQFIHIHIFNRSISIRKGVFNSFQFDIVSLFYGGTCTWQGNDQFNGLAVDWQRFIFPSPGILRSCGALVKLQRFRSGISLRGCWLRRRCQRSLCFDAVWRPSVCHLHLIDAEFAHHFLWHLHSY